MPRVRATVALLTILIVIATGCDPQSPAEATSDNTESESVTDEDGMYTLVSDEAAFVILKNVDRPFEVTFETPAVLIRSASVGSSTNGFGFPCTPAIATVRSRSA